jgi:hypothetical protein
MSYTCPRCGEEAPHGDARIGWLSYHGSAWHIAWCWLTRRFRS